MSKVTEEAIQHLLLAVWQKVTKEPRIFHKTSHFRDIRDAIERETGVPYSFVTIRNWFSKKNHPSRNNLDVLTTYLLGTKDGESRSFTRDYLPLVIEHPISEPSKQISNPFSGNHLRTIGLMLAAVSIIALVAWSLMLGQNEPVKIRIYSLIRDKAVGYHPDLIEEDFGTWLTKTFNDQYEGKFEVEIRDPQERKSAQRRIDDFIRTSGYDTYDILMGGLPIYHTFKQQMSVEEFTKDLNLESRGFSKTQLQDPDQRWIPLFLGSQGIYANKHLVADSILTKYEHLMILKEEQGEDFRIPSKESSSFYNSFFSIGLDGDKNRSVAAMIEKYKALLERSTHFDNQYQAMEAVHSRKIAASVVWLHDLITIVRKLEDEHPDINVDFGFYIPEESLLEIGCISVFKREGDSKRETKRQEAIKAFIRFLLSDEVQVKHFELQYRIPVTRSAFNKVADKRVGGVNQYGWFLEPMEKILNREAAHQPKTIFDYAIQDTLRKPNESWLEFVSPKINEAREFIKGIDEGREKKESILVGIPREKEDASEHDK